MRCCVPTSTQLRNDTFYRQKALGIFPQDAELPANDRGLPSWDNLTATEKSVHEKQAEVRPLPH